MALIRGSPTPVGKREIARAFGLDAPGRIALKALLKELEHEGHISRDTHRHFTVANTLPKITVLKITRISRNGETIAEPEGWDGPDRPQLTIVERRHKRTPARALTIGDRVLARIEAGPDDEIYAHPLKTLERKTESILGILQKTTRGFHIAPIDRRIRTQALVDKHDLAGASVGELVRAEPVDTRAHAHRMRIIARLGSPFDAKSFSLIAIHQHKIPHVFSDVVTQDAIQVATQSLDNSEDLTHIPFITIDPSDARDHDDALFVAPREAGGYDVMVAIADVSLYVRPGSALDVEACARGNSVYFPDQVVPMLPEVLSTDVCSLLPERIRACLVAHLSISAAGVLETFRFTRARIRSVANLTYEEAQAIADGHRASPLQPLITSLWAAWRALTQERARRAPLDLDAPERRVVLDDAGKITQIAMRVRLEAHQVVEECMILANVAAARQLELKKSLVVYRLHEAPTREKCLALKDFLDTLDQKFALGQVIRAELFNALLARTKDHPAAALIQTMVLRTQMQAYYGLQKLGHFGLSLPSYAHFTSPIRRYADLLVHRALVAALDLPDPDPKPFSVLERTTEHLSQTERRAMIAERDTLDRYVAAHLTDRVGQAFTGRVSSITRFGMFVSLDDIGAEGLVPMSALGDERFVHHEKAHVLEGTRSGICFGLGQSVRVRLMEANPLTGGLIFALERAGDTGERLTPRPKKPRGRPIQRKRRQS